MKATARANTNIALIKYWGKRDKELFLPMNSSLSITLDQFYTTTTVEFRKDLVEDRMFLNEKETSELEHIKISRFLDRVRKIGDVSYHAEIRTVNNVPTAAGFASSASGYAALAAASSKALNLNLSERELSILARQGSGSACRSIYGGFVEWKMGTKEDGSDSHGVQLLKENNWDLRVLSVVVATKEKKVSSRDGMERTVATSPFYQGWLDSVDEDMKRTKQAINNRDFKTLGETLEHNGLKMHGTMMSTLPPIIYWESGTLEVIHSIEEFREEGKLAYYTIDAGANVKVITLPEYEEELKYRLSRLHGVNHIIPCAIGGGIMYL